MSKLKEYENFIGDPTLLDASFASKDDMSLVAQIYRLNKEMSSLKRQGKRLTGQAAFWE